MKEIYDARPCVARDQGIRKEMNAKLLESYRYLLTFITDNYSLDVERYQNLLAQHQTHYAVSGHVFSTYNNLVDAVEAEDESRICAILIGLEAVERPHEHVHLSRYATDVALPLRPSLHFSMTRDFHQSFNGDYDVTEINSLEYQSSLAAAKTALYAINTVDRESADEINVLISDILFFASNNIHAFSCFLSFGFIYLSNLKSHEHWTRYFEHIIHEAAHNHLFMLMTIDPLIIEDENAPGLYSPFRHEKRPATGVYHAMFVLARTIRSFNLLLKTDEFSGVRENIVPVYNKQDSTRLSFVERFDKTYDVLKENVRMTDVGAKLLESCREIVYE